MPEMELQPRQKGTVMKVELKPQSWGERAIVTMNDGREVEVMRFDSAGTDHDHEVKEIAVCISGRGRVWMDGERGPLLTTGSVRNIPVGMMHHMEPDATWYEPFEWIIRYATP